MTERFRIRLAAALGTLALAAGGAVIAAPAAHATGSECANLIAGSNPGRSSTDVNISCTVGSLGITKVSDAGCNTLLTQLSQVSAAKAASACTAARN
ncbi:hypothetical protein AB0A70_12805 [Streptomyces morookaense]|uniref:hypothetical protein n=1 Tax=Streptomyces morookaense TaxID=1970 RepID=UPI0033E769C8